MKLDKLLEQKPSQVRLGGALWWPRWAGLGFCLVTSHEGYELVVKPHPPTGCWEYTLGLRGRDRFLSGLGTAARHAMHRAEQEAEWHASRLRDRRARDFG